MKLNWIGRKIERPELVDVVVLLSGGIDSAVTLGLALNDLVRTENASRRVIGLFIDYGQRSLEAEVLAVSRLATFFDVAIKYLRLDFTGISWSSLTGADGSDVTDQKSTFVPGRNIIFLSMAAAMAYSYGAKYVATGLAPGSGQIYPDTTTAFSEAMQAALQAGLYGGANKLTLYNPLLDVRDKLVICKLARKMGIPFHSHTVSCYDAKVVTLGSDTAGNLSHWIVPCGRCSPCKVRAWCRESLPFPFTNRDAILAWRG